MITHLLGQRSSNKLKMGTSIATIGIHGINFKTDDSSECDQECTATPPSIYMGVADKRTVQ